MSILQQFQTWYKSQCDGVWEHSYGVSIESCDNPGWWVKINLTGTSLEHLQFTEIAEGVDTQRLAVEAQWLNCRVENNTWHGAGDETKLERILEVFLVWKNASNF
jgi:Immunity protein 53